MTQQRTEEMVKMMTLRLLQLWLCCRAKWGIAVGRIWWKMRRGCETEVRASEQLPAVLWTAERGKSGGEKKQWPVASPTAPPAERRFLCNALSVWVSKRWTILLQRARAAHKSSPHTHFLMSFFLPAWGPLLDGRCIKPTDLLIAKKNA